MQTTHLSVFFLLIAVGLAAIKDPAFGQAQQSSTTQLQSGPSEVMASHEEASYKLGVAISNYFSSPDRQIPDTPTGEQMVRQAIYDLGRQHMEQLLGVKTTLLDPKSTFQLTPEEIQRIAESLLPPKSRPAQYSTPATYIPHSGDDEVDPGLHSDREVSAPSTAPEPKGEVEIGEPEVTLIPK